MLPNDPPDGNNNNSTPASPAGGPPPFGSNFNSHTNPQDPNNPYSSQPPPSPPPQNPVSDHYHDVQSEIAKHRQRDAHGRFISEHPDTPTSQASQTPQNPPNPAIPPNPDSIGTNPSSFLPPIIEVNQNTQASDKKDPPLFGFFLTNPVTYLKLFLKRLLKRQAVTLRIPVLAILIIAVAIGGYGAGLKTGIDYTLGKLFPNFSPILHRSISAQGTIQKSSKGYYLQANDKAKSLWMLKPVSDNLNLSDFVDLRVQIKGNLTPTPNLIEVAEVISFDTKADTKPTPTPTSQPTPIISNTSTNPNLPALYSNLTWETPKNKVLTFTSGTRKIEQEVIYIESLPVDTYPQDFISYYTQQLSNSGFKQTLNSSEPDGIAITYSKANLFLTFGVKNILDRQVASSAYSGTGESKKISGYKAFVEHN